MNKKVDIKKALTIAGSDSCGGAGIQADIKTMTVHGVYSMSAITALTAQNTTGVADILTVPKDFLASQLDMIFDDIYPDATKIGMVSSKDLVKVIASKLKEYNAKNIVVDPVMISTSGRKLIDDECIEILENELLGLADIITPNLFELAVLAHIDLKNFDIFNEENILLVAKKLAQKYNTYILAKGGHSKEWCNDYLVSPKGSYKCFRQRRIDNPNTHGTGCTLSSAIASNMAKGESIVLSVQHAKEYLTNVLKEGLDIGKGSGPLKHS